MEKIDTGIYRLPDGRLKVHTTATDPYTGAIKHRRETLSSAATLEDARAKREQLKAEIQERTQVRVASGTVLDYADTWLEVKVNRLKPSVRRGYVRAMEVMCGSIGALPIADVGRPDILRFRRHIEAATHDDGSPYSTHTIRGWWRISKIMWADAVADGAVATNPTLRIDPPTTSVVEVQERDTLSADELGRFVEAARQGSRYAEIVTLAYTGMRAGELYGLTWDALDLDGGTAVIRQAVSNRVLVRSTKTGAPRIVPLPDIVVNALRAHRPDGAADGLVFPASNGKPRAADTLRRALDAAVEIVNKEAKQKKLPGISISVRPQVLRRTFNTLLVSAGVDRIVQRSMMGHTSEQMTERYSGVRMEDKKAAVLRLIQGGE